MTYEHRTRSLDALASSLAAGPRPPEKVSDGRFLAPTPGRMSRLNALLKESDESVQTFGELPTDLLLRRK